LTSQVENFKSILDFNSLTRLEYSSRTSQLNSNTQVKNSDLNWVLTSRKLDSISMTRLNAISLINNVYALSTRHHCCHLHQLYITYTIYNVIYTHYNWRWIIIQLKVSLFLVFSQRFEDFYWKLLERMNECASLFIRINKDINYWDQEWTHLEKKTIVMMNWLIEIKSKTKVRNWVKDQIWIDFETLWLCQDII